jgi:hypothetical protein
MAVTYAKYTEMVYKAGASVSTTASGTTFAASIGPLIEGNINVASQYDWSSWYTSAGSAYPYVSDILVDAASNLGAMYMINYDMSGFTNIQEAVSRQNTLYTIYISEIALLKEEAKKDFLNRGGS